MPYQFNMIHMLPQSKIPCKRLPLDGFISTQVAFYRKKERSQAGGRANITAATAGRVMSQREEMEELAVQAGLLMIPEF